MRILNIIITAFLLISVGCKEDEKLAEVTTYPAPESEDVFPDYKIKANNEDVFCYKAEVYDKRFPEGFKHDYDFMKFSSVGIAYFDISGKTKISIKVDRDITSAVIRPLSRNINATVTNNTIEFYVDKPGSLTIEPNGSEKRVLHLFVNPTAKKPDINAENIIYFGPGEHVVNTIDMKSNQTLYVDGGAVVYFDVFENDTIYRTEEKDNGKVVLKRYDHGINANHLKNIKIKGRGILDFSRISEKKGRRNPIHINNSENVEVEGIIIRSSPCWNVTFYRSKDIVVDNIKLIGWDFNTDGIDVVLSQNVHIKNSFMRLFDDNVTMKSMDTGNQDCFISEIPQPKTTTSNILVENMVVWNDRASSFSVTCETRMPIKDIVFKNCDIINVTNNAKIKGALEIFVSDSSSVSNIKFKNINIERSNQPLIVLNQRLSPWTINKNFGPINNIEFDNIKYLGENTTPPIIIKGSPEKGGISNIYFNNIVFSGKTINSTEDWDFKMNEHVKGIHFNRTN